MSKRGYREIRLKLLEALDKEPRTYAALERILSTNSDTIRMHCQDLEVFGVVKIIKKEKHKANGRSYFIVEITSDGRKALKRFNCEIKIHK